MPFTLQQGRGNVEKKDMKQLLSAFALVLAFTTASFAKEFEIFDGQFYNGLFYPMIDIIEWGEQDHELPHMEFHLHSKEKPIDVSVVAGEKGGKPVLWIMYDLKFRGERVCRHVLAPSHFREGMQLFVYRDNSDSDYDNVYVYSQPWVKRGKSGATEYTMPPYERCSDENASNMPSDKSTVQAQGNSAPQSAAPAAPAERTPASVSVPAPAAGQAPPPREGKGVPIDYDNTAVPFSF